MVWTDGADWVEHCAEMEPEEDLVGCCHLGYDKFCHILTGRTLPQVQKKWRWQIKRAATNPV